MNWNVTDRPVFLEKGFRVSKYIKEAADANWLIWKIC
jgi:hypothetical protein